MMVDISALFQSSGAAGASTFLGVDLVDPHDIPSGTVAVLGIPGATPYSSAGAYCAAAPAAIRAANRGYSANLAHHDFDLGGPLLPPGKRLVDCGDLAFEPNDFEANRRRIHDVVAACLDRNAVPVVLGGDDSVQIPLLQAFAAHSSITILQIDAHIDWRDEVQGERLGLSSTMRRASEMAGVKAIVQVGARAVGSARSNDLADALAWGVAMFDMQRIRREGLAAVAGAVPAGQPVVVCLDVDGLDPSVVPSVIGRAPGGLLFGDAVELLHTVATRAPVVGFNVVEVVPENDIGGLGVQAAARLVCLGIGLAARGG